MSQPTIEESQRLVLRLNGAGTVRRLDFIHQALVLAYRLGQADLIREQQDECDRIEAEQAAATIPPPRAENPAYQVLRLPQHANRLVRAG